MSHALKDASLRFVYLAFAVLASACSDGNNPMPDMQSDMQSETQTCAEEHADTVGGSSITVCTKLFAQPPYVRLPADTAEVAYVGVQGGKLVSRTTTYSSADPALISAEVTSGDYRYGYHIYRATLSGGTPVRLERAVRIDDRAMQTLLGGLVLEGHVSPRNPGNTSQPFAFDHIDAPMRVELDAAPADMAHDQITGYPRFAVAGHIANANKAVRGADGTCLPALASLGAADPLSGAADDRIFVLRYPDMHGAFDDVFTFDWPTGVTTTNNMGTGLFVSTISLATSTAFAPKSGSSAPHGTPWGGPSTDLAVVQGGGADCTP